MSTSPAKESPSLAFIHDRTARRASLLGTAHIPGRTRLCLNTPLCLSLFFFLIGGGLKRICVGYPFRVDGLYEHRRLGCLGVSKGHKHHERLGMNTTGHNGPVTPLRMHLTEDEFVYMIPGPTYPMPFAPSSRRIPQVGLVNVITPARLVRTIVRYAGI